MCAEDARSLRGAAGISPTRPGGGFARRPPSQTSLTCCRRGDNFSGVSHHHHRYFFLAGVVVGGESLRARGFRWQEAGSPTFWQNNNNNNVRRCCPAPGTAAPSPESPPPAPSHPGLWFGAELGGRRRPEAAKFPGRAGAELLQRRRDAAGLGGRGKRVGFFGRVGFFLIISFFFFF